MISIIRSGPKTRCIAGKPCMCPIQTVGIPSGATRRASSNIDFTMGSRCASIIPCTPVRHTYPLPPFLIRASRSEAVLRISTAWTPTPSTLTCLVFCTVSFVMVTSCSMRLLLTSNKEPRTPWQYFLERIFRAVSPVWVALTMHCEWLQPLQKNLLPHAGQNSYKHCRQPHERPVCRNTQHGCHKTIPPLQEGQILPSKTGPSRPHNFHTAICVPRQLPHRPT